jgi:hypothetical protein
MLAQNFKTPADLEIREVEFKALVTTLGMLERGELKMASEYARDGESADPSQSDPGLFHMAAWCTNAGCGTVMCIGGTAECIMKQAFKDIPDGLDDLFHMYKTPHGFRDVTVEKAAAATRNYLTYGDARWNEVFAG